jgi:hypothetical protein
LGFVGSLLGTNGGANGTGFAAPQGTTIISPTSAAQANTAYNGNQQALSQQQNFLNAVQGQNGLGNQSQVYGQLQNITSGQGPNPAQNMLNQATGQNVANQAALMAGQRGSGANAGLMARQAAQQGAATQQQAVGQGATMQANQSLGALSQAGSMANTQAAQQAAATSAVTNAQQAEQANLLNSIAGINNANVSMQSNMNSANAALAGQEMQSQNQLLGNVMNGAGSAMQMMADGGEADDTGGNSADDNNQSSSDNMPSSNQPAAISSPTINMSTGNTGNVQVPGIASSNVSIPAISNAFQSSSGGGGGGGGMSSLMGLAALAANGGEARLMAAEGVQVPGIASSNVSIPSLSMNPFAPQSQSQDQSKSTQTPSGKSAPQSTMGKFMSGMGSMFASSSDATGSASAPSAAGNAAANVNYGLGMNPSGQAAQDAALINYGMSPQQFAHGGKVPALVSPGEIRIHAKDVKKVAEGKKSPLKGEKIPGKPKVGGATNSYANDTVKKTLNEGDIILPRSVTQSKHPHWAAHKFVQDIMMQKHRKK